MNGIRIFRQLGWSAPVALAALVSPGASANPVPHVDIKTVKSYEGSTLLPKPDRVIVYDFTVAPEVVKTDRTPGVVQRVQTGGSNSKEAISQQTQNEITGDLIMELQKRLSSSGIPVEKGTPEMQVEGNSLTIRGTITKLNQGHRLRRATVGLGTGASDVETDCQISAQTGANSVLISELKTVAKSGKKPGAAVTAGAGAAPAVAAGATGATAHKSTAQGDAARTGSALAKNIADLMKNHGWITTENQQTSTEAQSK